MVELLIGAVVLMFAFAYYIGDDDPYLPRVSISSGSLGHSDEDE